MDLEKDVPGFSRQNILSTGSIATQKSHFANCRSDESRAIEIVPAQAQPFCPCFGKP
jgi:hypothetical protein